ncbi:MAG: primase protein [Candidatus Magasanikbacteria bacterium GW2011_GWC2_40_17]|uniref:DNA primase n=1 Tax=Candidatus Magasanikbacteria bacterium GW2011_GWA2_42_32 TaxID=1619039 RepID=A0A0G1A9B9_9BACT|nr:MAG: primase protein [Candidatus Magasanikbacteria bacterium GW2011_GWC2_40_17]KKS57612.1 MAG: primase protein [Candidatus Magasanikbacteria bacterium GW2011_GWA2_42_32]OGH85014.1 MAG: DNA primase [Candidatus Magasanikbacteria bacterium RIFOXYB2_FULL_38_10]
MSQATEDIKSKISIVDFVSEYLPLKRAGATYKASCPFHQEKTPSFIVSPERQSWHCFGCNIGGDVFEFLMKMENLEFPEALKILADKAGVKLPEFGNEISSSQRNRLLDILKLAAKFYHKILLDSPKAEEARNYLFVKRQVSQEVAEDFLLGYIPEDWDFLTNFLVKKGYGINDILSSGLTIKKDGGGYYDRFRDRVMFPINDVHGNVVGFTGRLLHEKPEAGGKYVNTPQTSVFDKGKVIYALDKAKQEARRQDKFIIVEGQMDVVMSHQFQITNTVASSGTALTREQIKLLKRFTSNLIIAFDVDSAGQNATARGIELALSEGLKIKIAVIPPEFAKDPDECLKKDKNVWFKALENAQSIMEYFFSSILGGKDLTNPEVRGQVSTSILEKIKLLPDSVEQDFWIKKLAAVLDLRVDVLYEKIKGLKGGPVYHDEIKKAGSVVKSKEELTGEKMLCLLIRWPLFFETAKQILHPEFFINQNLKNLYENLILFYNTAEALPEGDVGVIHSFKAWKGQNEVCQIIDILDLLYEKEYFNLSQKEAEEEIISVAKRLKMWYNNAIRKTLEKEMAEAEKNSDKEKILFLMEKFKDFL